MSAVWRGEEADMDMDQSTNCGLGKPKQTLEVCPREA